VAADSTLVRDIQESKWERSSMKMMRTLLLEELCRTLIVSVTEKLAVQVENDGMGFQQNVVKVI
jgi:hypothetical protein